jgi:hypothetical protein
MAVADLFTAENGTFLHNLLLVPMAPDGVLAMVAVVDSGNGDDD